MKRREFFGALGGAAAWPLVAHAQQQTMPVIGILLSQSPDAYPDLFRAFGRGLKETGYVEGENVLMTYRFAENQIDRLPELVAELVRRPVTVIAAEAVTGALAAKAATSTIPIVIALADDPVRLGLVASLARPGGNVTGINFLNVELTSKRLELLRELVPSATRVGVLVNPSGPGADALRDMEPTARSMGLQIQIFRASSSREIDEAFATFGNEPPHALFVRPDPFFRSRRVHLALATMRYRIPAAYALRDYVEAGGLMSYGASLADAYREAGIYVGRILKGGKPADMPVVQSRKFELVINSQTARMLGMTVPPSLLARADEVIE